jgi:hypothetical protein
MPHVTQAEARVLAEAVRRRAGYLWELCRRMERTGRTQDPLYRDAVRARDAVHGLWVGLHYRGCGMGKPPADGGDGPAPDPLTGGW